MVLVKDISLCYFHWLIFLLYPTEIHLGTFDFMYDTYVHIYNTFIPIYVFLIKPSIADG